MVTKLKRDPLAPLLCVLESVQDNESYFWDTTLDSQINDEMRHGLFPKDDISEKDSTELRYWTL
jgi:hypothetical protein